MQRKNLLAVANQTDLPLVFLTSGFGSRITGDDITYGEAVTPAGLAEVGAAHLPWAAPHLAAHAGGQVRCHDVVAR